MRLTMKKAAAKQTTTTGAIDEVKATGMFGSAMIDIGWKLLISMLIFLLGGKWLDGKFKTEPTFMIIGFVLFVASFALIVQQVLQKIPKEYGGLMKSVAESKAQKTAGSDGAKVVGVKK